MKHQSSDKQITVLAGPTASGKTSLAAELIKQYPFEIVSADSRQVYRGLDIGTGKDKTIPQQMIDVIEPPRTRHLGLVSGSRNKFGMTSDAGQIGTFSVSQYRDMALPILDDIWSRGKIPLVVGGTGYYIDALILQQSYNKVAPNSAIRHQLESYSNEMLLDNIKDVDPRLAEVIDVQNRVRLIRAVEIIRQTNAPVELTSRVYRPDVEVDIYVLDVPRQELYGRIDTRVDDRLKQGMIKEVENLLQSGVPAEWLISLGLEYRFIAQYLQGIFTYDEMVQKLKFAIHAYARRQLTYFRRFTNAEWLDTHSISDNISQRISK